MASKLADGERVGERLVAVEEEGDAVRLGGEGLRAVGPVHGPVQRGVGLDERRRHGERVVEVRERGARVEVGLARREHGLGRPLHRPPLLLRRRLRPREVVVDDGVRVAVPAF